MSSSRLAQLASAAGLAGEATPFLAIDVDILERNIERMAAYFRDRPAGLRPHFKHHKCTEIARLQLAAGARGITCATTDELGPLVAAGIDALLANVVADPVRLEMVAALARTGDVTVAVDSREAATALAGATRRLDATVGVVVDLDVGLGRTGAATVAEAADLAATVETLPGLRFRGVMAYEGHVVEIENRRARHDAARASYERLRELVETLRERDLEVAVVTGGSTATYEAAAEFPMTDVQAGSYALMDADYARRTPEFVPALAVVATVVSARRGHVVVDAGSKRLGGDLGAPALAGCEGEHVATSEEHAEFLVGGRPPRVGERVALVPGHTCTTMSLHRVAFGCRDGSLERPLVVDGRDPRA